MNATRFLASVLLFGCVVSYARAQTVPLHVGVTNPIMSEAGQLLPGTEDAAAQYGCIVQTGGVVQILLANSGKFPPDIDGNPDVNNSIVYSTFIGKGTDPSLCDIGKFGASIPDRPATQVFARVFNRNTVEGSSFYGDSQLYGVPQFGSGVYGVFIAKINSTSTPLDPADDDGDAVNNSWEKSLGSDRNKQDTDDDGVSDGAEFQSGTDLTDENSYLQMVQLKPAGNDMIVIWDSVSNKSYQVEFTADDLSGNPAYSNVSAIITATGLVSSTVVTNGLSNGIGHYRVWLVGQE